MSAYLYLVYSQNGDLARLGDFLESADAAAAQKAEGLLRADREAGRVEIWRGERLLGVAG